MKEFFAVDYLLALEQVDSSIDKPDEGLKGLYSTNH